MNPNSRTEEHATRKNIVARLLAGRGMTPKFSASAEAYAPANIALVKYWGKRNEALNLPVTSSLSISLGALGSHVRLSRAEAHATADQVILNGEMLPPTSKFVYRASDFLDVFRPSRDFFFSLDTRNTIPTAAGFASSASGFAALVKALDILFRWQLTPPELSILARLGSGSAARSLWDGFVEWNAGTQPDGMDSFGTPLEDVWPNFRIGALVLCAAEKPVGSKEGMRRCVENCSFYAVWPERVKKDLAQVKQAIHCRDFPQLGIVAEGNALAMHALMMATQPPLVYWQPESVAAMHTIWNARADGLPLWFTMDAGPNIKLLFEAKDESSVRALFPAVQVVSPFTR